MFLVSDVEWAAVVELRHRDEVLCRACFDWIRLVKAKAAARRASAGP
jgi:hypothetical protein